VIALPAPTGYIPGCVTPQEGFAMASPRTPLPPLSFAHFFSYDEVTAAVTALATARPDLVTLSSLGKSREGRELHLLTVTDPATGTAADKPAYLIHGNIHAAELSGTHAALYTARQLLAEHARTPNLLREMAFHIVPRLNPDGAEFVVGSSGSVRSRIDRSTRKPNTLYQQDLNGDGLILTMRQKHPDGNLALDPKEPRLLVRRTKESEPPFYRTFPEGVIHDWDGTDTIAVEGRHFDWNRNWSYDWRPEPEQGGAGDFPFSEVEMRAMAEFIHSHPNLFGILGYHNGPNGMLRPPSTGADTDLDAGDVRTMDEIARFGAKQTGFPLIPVVKYHRKGDRDINLRGHFHNFGYHHLGLFVFEFELGTILNSAGFKTEEIFGIENEKGHERIMRKVLRWWDKQKSKDPLFMPWHPFHHPQLGRVDIGGLLVRHLAGPTLRDLEKISADTYAFTLEHASYRPRIAIENVRVEPIDKHVFRIRARVANRGQFPTHISNKGRNLRRLEPVRVEFHPAKGVELLSAHGHLNLGHLGPLTDSRLVEWFVRAPTRATELCHLAVKGGTGGNVSAVVPRA
jgi:hypothetical protein